MAASFPSSVKTFTVKTDKVDLVAASHINDIQDEIFAMQKYSLRSGTSFPTSDIGASTVFHRTDQDQVYFRNAANNAWLALSLADGAVTTAKLADGAVTEIKIGSSAVSQSKLKTATWEGSVGQVNLMSGGSLTGTVNPGGGEYGFDVLFKVSTASGTGGANVAYKGSESGPFVFSSTTYALYRRLYVHNPTGGDLTIYTYAYQRYITASGKDHWIFLLVDRITKQIVSSYQAPDHPSANLSGATELDIPHPFGSYDPVKHEIVIVDNDMLNIAKTKLTRKRSLLEIINNDFIIDDYTRPKFEPREIIKINEFPDDPLGEQLEIIQTPQWAKILIRPDYISRDRRMVEKLPENILFKKMVLK